jgi:hypothetical protein
MEKLSAGKFHDAPLNEFWRWNFSDQSLKIHRFSMLAEEGWRQLL